MSITQLQTKIGLHPDGQFGPETLKAAATFYKLDKNRAAHFFGQTCHETGGFKCFTENLNYSDTTLMKVWPKIFPADIAKQYARKPEQIANRAYANRMGNGTEGSGDGWKFRGRGAIQLTGRDNYKLFADHIGHPEILTNPDLVETEYAFESAMFFFDKNKLWSICDGGIGDDIISKLTLRINGGTNGLPERQIQTKAYYSYF
jgi:putative chitinase